MSGRAGSRLVTALVGNPRPRSRTYEVALRCAERIAERIDAVRVEAIDLVDLGPDLLRVGSEAIGEVRKRIAESAVLVVASPTYKATYTGVLKLLFDQIPAGELCGTIGLPLMVGGAASHALAVDLHLRPLLIEVGCSCPTAGLFVLESELPRLDETLSTWLLRWQGALMAPLR
jgi:FMN reductase